MPRLGARTPVYTTNERLADVAGWLTVETTIPSAANDSTGVTFEASAKCAGQREPTSYRWETKGSVGGGGKVSTGFLAPCADIAPVTLKAIARQCDIKGMYRDMPVEVRITKWQPGKVEA